MSSLEQRMARLEALPPRIRDPVDLSKLTPDERKEYRAIRQKTGDLRHGINCSDDEIKRMIYFLEKLG
jgi:hypothetical protein